MMDRNLHVMDMRHTLPNLKNLLLTLTTGEEIKPMCVSGSLYPELH
jgi:UV radiation resistance-associated gene protein